MARPGDASRESLIIAAERLFAVHGVEHASLRDIALSAGHRNNSAVQYHFGDRDGLVAAVYSRGMEPINHERLAMLASNDRDSLDVLVDALLSPLARHVERSGGWYGRFLARNRFERIARDVRGNLPESVVLRRITGRIGSLLVDLPRDVRAARLEQVVNHYVAALASWEWARDRGEPRLALEVLRSDLVSTCIAMLEAEVALVPGRTTTGRTVATRRTR